MKETSLRIIKAPEGRVIDGFCHDHQALGSLAVRGFILGGSKTLSPSLGKSPNWISGWAIELKRRE